MVPILIFSISSAQSADHAGKNLLSYFSSTCPSQGDWTKLVNSDAEALINILNSLKDDPDCVSAAGSIAQLHGLASKMTQLKTNNQRKIDIEKLKAKEIELSNQIGQTSDPLIISSLQAAIRGVQVEKAMLLAEDSSKKELAGEGVGEAYSQIVLSTNQFYKSIASNTKCLDKNPRIISSVTSLVSSIGAGVALVNPALGIGLSATSEILGTTVEAARVGSINRKIRKISDGTLINSGFKCALESLSNRWCELSDARKLLDFKFNLIKEPDSERGYLSAATLYDRKIPAFLDWLSKVRAGAPAATESDASRHAVVYERLKIVQVASSKGDGTLTEFKKRFYDPTTVTAADKHSVIRQVIGKLTGQCTGAYTSISGEITNPLFDIYNTSYAPYRLLGLDSIPRAQGGYPITFCDFDPFTQWPNGTYVPSYENIEKEYSDWIKKATILVNREFTQVLQPDSLGVLSTAFERTGSKWKISPKQAMDEIRTFLMNNRPQSFETSAFRKIYADIETKLDLISGTLTDALVIQSTSPSKAIETIFNAADLQFGTVVFSSRLEMTVRIALDEYFKRASPEDQNIAAQMLAMESYLETLRKVSGKDSDELVMLDVQNAQKGALSNMRNFVDVFAKNINQLLKNNNKKITATNDASQKTIDEEDQARICVLLSSMPQISDKIDMSLCYGKKLKAMIKDGPETSVITQKYLQEDFSKRNCAYRDYIRKSKIYREWDIKL